MPPKPIEIFRPGKHSDALTADVLREIAASYDPTLHEAPLVKGHPEHDMPAYGWAESLAFREGALWATPKDVDAQFSDDVKQRRFGKISSAFYAPDSKYNPTPGKHYLRHIGFLGAQPPVVKGMRNPEFSEEEQEGTDYTTYEFSEPDPAPEPESNSSTKETDPMTEEELKQQQKELEEAKQAQEAEKQKLAEKEKSLEEKESKFAEKEARNARRAELDPKVEKWIADGKILPGEKEGVLQFMEQFTGTGEEHALEFGEGDDAYKGDAQTWFEKFVDGLSKRVEFSEVSGADKTGGAAVSRTHIPREYTVDPEREAIHQKALQYAEDHKVSYETAVTAVSPSGA